MPSLKDIRRRIDSVRNTQQITKAMKMVAAAKLRRAQEAAEGARPYAGKLTDLLGNLSENADGSAHPFLGGAGEGPAHVIVVTSDRGLCGGYNASLIKTTEAFLASEEHAEATLTVCGRRGYEYFGKRVGERCISSHVNRPGGFDLDLARETAEEAATRFTSGQSGSVYLAYTKFQSAISQTPTVERLLPIESATPDSEEASESTDYLYEPSPTEILDSLLSRYVETQVFQAMLEATASEHGARMTAMDNASRNASDMIDRLTLAMNRVRQASITTELMEIVGGAEALNG